jgi:formylmethanofuran dehydrogenase subunit E
MEGRSMKKSSWVVAIAAVLAVASASARAESPEEWITLGARVHGGFGAFIPVGIRIGLDALERLKAGPREVTVLYFDSDKAPCACIADGIMLATVASPGQRAMQIAPERAPPGTLAVVTVRHRKTGEAVQYTIADTWLPKLGEWNKALDPKGRYDEVMKAEGLFTVAPVK